LGHVGTLETLSAIPSHEEGRRVITGISEFTFGYAFLFEQTRRHWGTLVAAPLLPSLQQEADEGWDARLPTVGTPFFYQFKLSDYLWAGNSKYIRDGTYSRPYYRIALHRRDRNRQHRLLRRLTLRHPHTYYVAPEFTGIAKFNASFRLIPVERCRDYTDADQHFITYQPGDPAWIEHSEPLRHESSERGEGIESLYRTSEDQWRRIDLQYAQEWYSAMLEDVRSSRGGTTRGEELTDYLLEGELDFQDRNAVLMAAAELVATHCGATTMLVGIRPTEEEQEGRNGR
jgi:hypothetical protein